MKTFILTIIILFSVTFIKAQNKDSVEVVKTTKEIFKMTQSIDWLDDNVIDLGMFYKLGPYMVYRGSDKTREWKDTCNYRNKLEQRYVDDVCYRINSTVNQGAEPKFGNFNTKTESEGKWYTIEVKFFYKGQQRTTIFAYLKIYDRFVLGDID